MCFVRVQPQAKKPEVRMRSNARFAKINEYWNHYAVMSMTAALSYVVALFVQ